MIKAILFDADGVVLVKHKEYFSERFAREYNAPIEELRMFFRTEFPECQEGKRDLKEELGKRLPGWNWGKGVDAFLEYWFANDIVLDHDVFAKVQQFKDQGIDCYLATDQEKYRAEYLRKNCKLDEVFTGCFFSCELGVRKDSPEFFEKVIEKLDIEPSEIAYFDDDQKNVNVAKGLGINARFYSSIEDLDKN